jgi:hypothetical protein
VVVARDDDDDDDDDGGNVTLFIGAYRPWSFFCSSLASENSKAYSIP